MNRLLIFGAGGHGRELAWIAKRQYPRYRVEFVVDDRRYWNPSVDACAVHLFDDLGQDEHTSFIVALGSPHLRRHASEQMASKFRPTVIEDPSTIRSGRVTAMEGSVIMPGCILTTEVVIGKHSHLNIGCRISHDVVLGDFVTLSPGVHLAGNVEVGDGAFLGINSTVINGNVTKPLVIGKGAVIAAGACVISDIPPFSMAAGVPAIVKKILDA